MTLLVNQPVKMPAGTVAGPLHLVQVHLLPVESALALIRLDPFVLMTLVEGEVHSDLHHRNPASI